MMDSRNVEEMLDKLSLSPSKDEKNSAFCRELKKAGLDSFFVPVSDHGFFAWRPKGPYKNLSEIKSPSEVTNFVYLNARPKDLVPLSTLKLPFAFRSLPAQSTSNKFPFGRYDIACLYVAAKIRSVDFKADVDFVFGGSTLEMLARMDANDPYCVTRIPHTDTILVVKCKDYIHNFADPGFQFERLVTGVDVAAKEEVEFVEHLHLMQVGSHRVFFRAETDALLEGEPVEVKASNPNYWGTKVMFQMISSGSTMLCQGVKKRGTVTGVNLRQLSEVAKDAFNVQSRSVLETNILRNMDDIKKLMEKVEDGKTFKISFSGGRLRLLPAGTRSATLLPPSTILQDLIS